ncbi:MAG: biotin/lipoate A/B protein ligase family protein [Chloroflexota bacterium]
MLHSSKEQFEPSQWRLIVEDVPRSGPANMAIDQAIAESAAEGTSPPTLRFYRWSPPAVSIGRYQPSSEIDFDAATNLGYEVVRRSTGGRAILHIDELTYSVAASRDEPRVQGSVMDSYLRLSNGLLAGLANLGVHADKADAHVRAGKDVSAACFEVPSAYEITVEGRKLIGSAQSRRRNYVLQHGTLPLKGDITRLLSVLILTETDRKALAEQLALRACVLSTALDLQNAPPAPLSTTEFPSEGSPLVPQDEAINMRSLESLFYAAVNALCQGFAKTLNLDFSDKLVSTAPSTAEMARAAQLIREQYGSDSWTFSK